MKERRFNWYLLISIVILTCIVSLTPSAHAATGLVTGKVVNLRTGPGTNYQISDRLGQGTRVTLLANKNGWYQVQLTNGHRGWMNSSYIKNSSSAVIPTTGANTAAATVSVKVTGSVVNLREAPSINSRIISRCQKGDVLTWNKTFNGWYQVTTKTRKTAFISSSYAILDKKVSQIPVRTTTAIPTQNTSVPNTANTQQSNLLVVGSVVNLRIGPGVEYLTAGQAQKNQGLNTDKLYNGWYRVLFGGKQVWIAENYVQLVKPIPSTPSREGMDRSAGEIVSLGRIHTNTSGVEALELQASSPISIEAGVSETDGIQSWDLTGAAIPSNISSEPGTAYEGLQIIPSGPEQATIKVKLRTGYQVNMTKVDPNTYRFYFQPVSTSPNLSLQPTIVIDPGHGGSDPGAMYFGANEKNLNLAMGLKLGQTLEQAGYHVVYTRNEDTAVSLSSRCQIANTADAVIFVSIHCNASSNKDLAGTTTYYCIDGDSSLTQKCRELSTKVQSSLISSLGTSDKGVRTDRFQVIRDTTIPSILVETAFMSNSQDFALLNNDGEQLVIAQSITQGIVNYLNEE